MRFWQEEATKKIIDNFLSQVRAVRIGMAPKPDYLRVIKTLENQKNLVGIPKTKIIEDNWADLKLLQRRR